MELPGLLSVIFLHVFIPVWAKKGEARHCPELVQESGYYTAVHSNTCYMFVNKEEYWTAASTHCQGMGGDLITVMNGGVMNFLKSELNSPGLGWHNQGVWIGAQHYEDRGWVWTTGEKVSYSYWARNEPSKTLLWSIENCALMRREDGWHWHDYHCGALKYHYYYICQFPTIAVTTPTTELPVIIVKQLDLRLMKHHSLEAIAHSYQDNGHLAHTASSGQQEDNGNMSILLTVIGFAGLVIFAMLLIFFIYRKRQRDKHNVEEMVVRYDNQAYGRVHQNEQGYGAGGDNDSNGRRPVSSMYMSPDEVNTLYEEVNKEVNHGVNTFRKETNCLAGQPPPPPPPRSDSASAVSLSEGGASGFASSDNFSASPEEPYTEPLIEATSKEESDSKGCNLYVDMKGGSKSSALDVPPEKMKKLMEEHTYTNTSEVNSDTENHYEDLPARL
ncbi:uncharacterized protein LOC124110846 isoform X1 [Haliotis rufescens]|uniref:uncharacterized protein LOC124110846 isoform X1 n=1 Tax=Haliotis rufescens TaxID=6454 RepID=UPI001EB01523|nr:uncharacterized protein LOC124110846 isoform X1 [Haliotis rufescens]